MVSSIIKALYCYNSNVLNVYGAKHSDVVCQGGLHSIQTATTNKGTYDSNANKSLFGSYLAGLLEGGGFIVFYDSTTNHLQIEIPFNLLDNTLVKFLIDCFGGEIKYSPTLNKEVWVISTKDKGFISFILLINGSMRTSNVVLINQIIGILNEYHGQNIPLKPIDTSCISSNAWLAGFIERKGVFSSIMRSFNVEDSEAKGDHQLTASLMISVKKEDLVNFKYVESNPLEGGNQSDDNYSPTQADLLCDYVDILNQIAKLLEASVTTEVQTVGADTVLLHVIIVDQLNQRDNVISYLSKYPMLGSNALLLNYWTIICSHLKEGEYFDGTDISTELINAFNILFDPFNNVDFDEVFNNMLSNFIGCYGNTF
jgi:hypothetical protein